MNNKIPTHVAFIMDGNSRWSKKNNLTKQEGYNQGIKTLEKIIEICIKLGIKIITVYALSTENTYRKDVNILYSLIKKFINNTKIEKFNNIDFRLIGDRKNINIEILSFFEKLEKNFNKEKKIILNLAYNYGSWNELEFCINSIINKYKDNNKFLVSENIIRSNLYTQNIPDPDILIRTGGNNRLSNFLLLQIKYTELFFIETLWPDFNTKKFQKILEEYQIRKRTYGL